MKYIRLILLLVSLTVTTSLKAHESLNAFSGLVSPESVVQDAKGDIYVSEIGEFNKDGDGKITRISIDGKLSTFASGMDDPKGLTFSGKSLFVTDKNRILKVEPNGKWTVFGSTMAEKALSDSCAFKLRLKLVRIKLKLHVSFSRFNQLSY